MGFYDNLAGFLLQWDPAMVVPSALVVALIMGYWGAPLLLWTVLGAVLLAGFSAPLGATAGFLVVMAVFLIPMVRRVLVTSPLMNFMKGMMPKISPTERVALEAGVVWAEADLFSGKPDFNKLMSEPYPDLTAEEKAFVEGPVEELCKMVSDFETWKTRELPPAAFEFIKKNKFLGMIIPKEYGGLGFSALAHSEVIAKLATRSVSACITTMVPNSLGPGELITHYGTDAQKKRWLPRLAQGDEIPCFGLTEPGAGSDASSIISEGVLFKGQDGKLYVRLNWNKRWITLAAISTVIGLAFRLRDPEKLLGKEIDLGITCGLIPNTTPGVVLGRRHDPLGVPFYNCPTQGVNVVLEAEDLIIGGVANAGKGWKMLIESLGAGRGISLPAQSAGGLKMLARVSSAQATIRKQFGMSIGKFEGIEEPLSRITGSAYFVEAMRKYTLGALDKGVRPPVVTAMAKYISTELVRKGLNDAMDIFGGAGISMGPRNVLAVPYIAAPIGITVEGANILTRTLMIFGQGALRAHPYAFKEVNSIEKGDVAGFDEAFWGHIGHIVRNTCRSVVLSVTRGRVFWATGPSEVRLWMRKMAWASATFAIMSDMAMGLLGGQLKVKEKLTGRYADILTWMYIGTAVLRRYIAEGTRKEDLPFVEYSMRVCFTNIQTSFDGIFANFDVPIVGWFFRGPLRWWSGLNVLSEPASDALTHKMCVLIMTDGDQRNRLTAGIYLPKTPEDGAGRLDFAFKALKRAEACEKKIRQAVKKGKLVKKKNFDELMGDALKNGVINQVEYDELKQAEKVRWDSIQVDDYSQEEYL